jgi:hypothetical protein
MADTDIPGMGGIEPAPRRPLPQAIYPSVSPRRAANVTPVRTEP